MSLIFGFMRHGLIRSFLSDLNELLKDGLGVRDVTLDLKSMISSPSVRSIV